MKTLNIGDSYQYMKHTLTVIEKVENFVLAFNPDYGYEVFKIRYRKASKLATWAISEPGEYPPSTSEFGKDAFHWAESRL